MSAANEQITALLNAYSTDDGNGRFLLSNSTDDFKFIRPSGNPVDAQGYADMFASGDIVLTAVELKKLHKLDVYGDIAFCAFTQSASFTYKGTPNDDIYTVSALVKVVDGKWKFAWMQRSTGNADMSFWA